MYQNNYGVLPNINPTVVQSIYSNAVNGYQTVNTQEATNSKPFDNKKKCTIALAEPVDFVSQIETQMMTTFDLSKLINTFFSQVIDYDGCIITVDQTGKLNVDLYFKENPNYVRSDKDNRPTTIKRVTEVIHSFGAHRALNPAQMVQNISNIMSSNSRLYTLTDEGKEYLYDFIYKQSNVPFEKLNWNQYFVEQSDQTYNMQTVYVKVSGIDLNEILKTIFGKSRKIEGQDKYSFYDYSVSIVRPVGVGYSNTQNYLITIQRFDQHQVEKLASKVGLVSTMGTIPIIRDTIA